MFSTSLHGFVVARTQKSFNLQVNKHCYKRTVPWTPKHTIEVLELHILLSILFCLIITTSFQHFHGNPIPTWRQYWLLLLTWENFFCNAPTVLPCVWKSVLACALICLTFTKYTRAKFYKRTRIKVVNLFSLEELLSMYINLFQTFLVFNLYVLWVSSWSLWYVLYE